MPGLPTPTQLVFLTESGGGAACVGDQCELPTAPPLAEDAPGASVGGEQAQRAANPQPGEEQALRIARLRAQVAAGAYHPAPEDIARAMVEQATG